MSKALHNILSAVADDITINAAWIIAVLALATLASVVVKLLLPITFKKLK